MEELRETQGGSSGAPDGALSELEQTGSLDVNSPYAIVALNDGVWVTTNTGYVERIDGESMEITDYISLEEIETVDDLRAYDLRDAVASEGVIWVVDVLSNSIYRIDTELHQTTGKIVMPGNEVVDLALDGEALWALSTGKVYRIDVGSVSITDEIAIPDLAPDAMVAYAGRLWLVQSGSLYELDIETRNIVGSIELSGGSTPPPGNDSIVVVDDRLWTFTDLPSCEGAIEVVDPVERDVVESIEADQVDGSVCEQAIYPASDGAWVYGSGMAVKVNSEGEPTDRISGFDGIPGFDGISGIVESDDGVWIVHAGDEEVLRYST